jgi:chaperonin GroEL
MTVLTDSLAARLALLRGATTMTSLLRPTLGPIPRTVAIARQLSSQPPEFLDKAALIARRTIELSDPFENMGGMLIRHLVWRAFEHTGDGTATAGVLAHALLRDGTRYIAAGWDPVGVRNGLELGVRAALKHLRAQARPIELPETIAQVVVSELGDVELANTLGQIVDAVGPDGFIGVEDAQGASTSHEYQDGMRWDQGGYVSTFLLKAGENVGRVLEPRVFVTDFELNSARQLLPALEACVEDKCRGLLVVATEVRDSAVGLLVLNRERGVLDDVLAVRAPSHGSDRSAILEDMAVATGARCILRERHDRLGDVVATDLGSARQAWANRTSFAILGGRGAHAAIRARIVEARAELGRFDGDDPARERIQERIGKLVGTAAAIRVGGSTQVEQSELKVRVESAVKTARAALRSGVVPGAGAALLACASALDRIQEQLSADEIAGVRLLAGALVEPMAVIAQNAGLEPGPILAEARRRGSPWLFDVVQRRWVDAWVAGVVDPVEVAATALQVAASSVATALTAEVLIHRGAAPLALQP